MEFLSQIKGLLSSEKDRIQLFEAVKNQTQQLLTTLDSDEFKLSGQLSGEKLLEHVNLYESILLDMCKAQALLAYWGTKCVLQYKSEPRCNVILSHLM